jgi:putative flippase GtrA
VARRVLYGARSDPSGRPAPCSGDNARRRRPEPCVNASSALAALPAPTPAALRLGHAGLLPFVLGAVLTWLVRPDAHPYVTAALSAYAAVIVSFLGGIHWGFAMRQSGPATSLSLWGVVPSLVAWVAVMMPAYAGLVVHGVMLVVCYGVDRRVYPAQGAAAWLTLRFRLTAVASLSCFIGAAGS